MRRLSFDAPSWVTEIGVQAFAMLLLAVAFYLMVRVTWWMMGRDDRLNPTNLFTLSILQTLGEWTVDKCVKCYGRIDNDVVSARYDSEADEIVLIDADGEEDSEFEKGVLTGIIWAMPTMMYFGFISLILMYVGVGILPILFINLGGLFALPTLGTIGIDTRVRQVMLQEADNGAD